VLTGVTPESLTAEIKLVRRGLGLYHPELARRLGPGLRDVCGVADADPAELRSKVITRLRDAASTLPPDLSLSVLAALGVHPETRALHQLQERVDWLAARLQRDSRTARRRMDEACAMLAEHMTAGRDRRQRRPSSGWYIESAQAAFVLDGNVPTVIERRVIVSEHDGLDQLVLSRTVPPAGGEGKAAPTISPIFGGALGIREWDSATRLRLVLDLPVVLRAGDRHEYAIAIRQPADTPMRPHYVFFPVVRVDHFDLHVRFGDLEPPEQVWRVYDSFHRDLDEQPTDRDRIELDRVGEVHLEFDDLAPGHGYGVRWA
jgi:hypothetical protein